MCSIRQLSITITPPLQMVWRWRLEKPTTNLGLWLHQIASEEVANDFAIPIWSGYSKLWAVHSHSRPHIFTGDLQYLQVSCLPVCVHGRLCHTMPRYSPTNYYMGTVRMHLKRDQFKLLIHNNNDRRQRKWKFTHDRGEFICIRFVNISAEFKTNCF